MLLRSRETCRDAPEKPRDMSRIVEMLLRSRETCRDAPEKPIVTFDYVDNRKIKDHGYGEDRTIFVIRDRYTGIIQAYPSYHKDENAVILAVKRFMGQRKIIEKRTLMALRNLRVQ